MSDRLSDTSSPNGRNKVIIVKHATAVMVSMHNNEGGGDRTYSMRCKKNTDTP